MGGEKSNAGEGAPTGLGGIVNAAMGRHAYKEEGKDDEGNKVTGYGSTSDSAHADYQRKGGK